nr:putative carbohydrate binding domain containing protein [uncultured Mediterranean phage uvMED]
MRWLIAFLFVFTLASAEEITTGNLITNGNFETGNANSWTTSGNVQVLNDCCELNNVPSNYDLEFGDSGSVEQDFNLYSDTINQNMLDNGITLNSTIEVQNGECAVAGCWGGRGNADTFTNQLTIKDSDGNVLASNTNIRTDVTGIDGANFNDTLIYNGTGSNVGNITITGSDANAPAYLGGPNLDNVSVTMTYDNTVIPATIVEEIENIFENVEEVFEELEFVAIEELFEELITFFEEPAIEMEVVEEFEEVSFEPVLMMIEEMPTEEELIAEEMIEELVMAEESMIEEEFSEEAIEEEFTEEEMIEEEPTKLTEAPNEREEVKQEKPNSKTAKTAEVKEKSSTKQKIIQSKERTANATSQPRLVNLEKIMDKVDKDIKDISKNLQIKNIIKLGAMTSEQASLDLYNVPFYKSEDIYLDQVQIQDLRQVYADTTLSNYISTDPIAIVNEKLNQINFKKQQILIELEQLKNG